MVYKLLIKQKPNTIFLKKEVVQLLLNSKILFTGFLNVDSFSGEPTALFHYINFDDGTYKGVFETVAVQSGR
jgi:hypothetical protein